MKALDRIIDDLVEIARWSPLGVQAVEEPCTGAAIRPALRAGFLHCRCTDLHLCHDGGIPLPG